MASFLSSGCGALALISVTLPSSSILNTIQIFFFPVDKFNPFDKFVLKFVIETKGKTLEEVEELLIR